LPDGRFFISEKGPPNAVKVLDSKRVLFQTIPLQEPATSLTTDASGRPQCLFKKAPPLLLTRSDSAQSPPTPP
jgi:hypothetical protein